MVWNGLLAGLATVLLSPTAEAADRSLAMTLEGPQGDEVTIEALVPSTSEHPITLGKRDYVLVAGTAVDGEQVSLTLDLKRVKPNGKARWVEEAEVVLTEGVAGEVALTARTRGAPDRKSTWTASGLWQTSWTAPAQTAAPDSKLRYVLAWADVGLSDDPRSGAFTARESLAERNDPSGQLTPFRVVMSFNGDIMEAKAVTEEDAGAHCYFRSMAEVNDWDRQFFLRTTDLAQVTTREVAVTLSDGTGVTLAAGVAVTPSGSGYRVEQDGLSFEVALPEDAVGQFYRLTGQFPPSSGVPGLSAIDGVLGRLETGAVSDAGGARQADGRVGVNNPLAVTRTGCMELTLAVEPAQFKPAPQ